MKNIKNPRIAEPNEALTLGQSHSLPPPETTDDNAPRYNHQIALEMGKCESEHQLHLITNALPALIAYIDTQQHYRFHNQFHYQWLSLTDKQINGQHIRDVYGDSAYQTLQPLIEAALAGEQVKSELKLSFQPDVNCYVMVNFIPSFSADRKVNGFCSLMSDITPVKSEDLHIKQRLQTLAHESRLTMIGEMTSEIAHELNQPLSAIANYCDASLRLHKSGKMLDQDITDVLQEIAGQAKRANKIITHLRNFTRKRALQFNECNINELIAEVLQLAASDSQWHNISVSSQLDKSIPRVCIDKVLIEQVILNLVRNAMEAMTNANFPDKTITIKSLQTTDNHTIIEITNSGPELPDTLINQIFEPFFTTKPDGMGLGLSICRSIIDSHGGQLWVKQTQQQGTTFCFSLPLSLI